MVIQICDYQIYLFSGILGKKKASFDQKDA